MKNILISFDMIYDKEYGLYKLLIEEYDENLFKFYSTSDSYLKEIIVQKNKKNPLDKIIDNSIRESIDILYEMLMNQEIDKILFNSRLTDFYNFVKAINKNYNVVILCKNKQEEQIIEKLNLKTAKTIISLEWTEELKTGYDAYYFRYLDDIDPDIESKNLYIAYTMYTFLDKENVLFLSNKIKLIELYKTSKPL